MSILTLFGITLPPALLTLGPMLQLLSDFNQTMAVALLLLRST